MTYRDSAARAIESVLAARHPEQTFVVGFGERHGGDGHGLTTTAIGEIPERPASEQPDPISDSDALPLTDTPDHHTIEKAA